MNLILASQSPRRRELMKLFRYPFSVEAADIDETMRGDLHPYDEVARVSRCKAQAVKRGPEDVVVAADTIVVSQGSILGKPTSPRVAEAMLRQISGREHEVMTGLTVLRGERMISCTEVTQVHFRQLTDREIAAYAATGEPMDKAGAYGIQGGAALFVERLVGDYYNVMGLPVCRLGVILGLLAPEIMGVTE